MKNTVKKCIICGNTPFDNSTRHYNRCLSCGHGVLIGAVGYENIVNDRLDQLDLDWPNADSLQYALRREHFAFNDVPNHLHQFTIESLDMLMSKFDFEHVTHQFHSPMRVSDGCRDCPIYLITAKITCITGKTHLRIWLAAGASPNTGCMQCSLGVSFVCYLSGVDVI